MANFVIIIQFPYKNQIYFLLNYNLLKSIDKDFIIKQYVKITFYLFSFIMIIAKLIIIRRINYDGNIIWL